MAERQEYRAALVQSLSPLVGSAPSEVGSEASHTSTASGETQPNFEEIFELALAEELRYTRYLLPRPTPYERVCAEVVNEGGVVRFPPLRWQQRGVADLP